MKVKKSSWTDAPMQRKNHTCLFPLLSGVVSVGVEKNREKDGQYWVAKRVVTQHQRTGEE